MFSLTQNVIRYCLFYCCVLTFQQILRRTYFFNNANNKRVRNINRNNKKIRNMCLKSFLLVFLAIFFSNYLLTYPVQFQFLIFSFFFHFLLLSECCLFQRSVFFLFGDLFNVFLYQFFSRWSQQWMEGVGVSHGWSNKKNKNSFATACKRSVSYNSIRQFWVIFYNSLYCFGFGKHAHLLILKSSLSKPELLQFQIC